MPDAAPAPVPVVSEPTKIPPPVAAGPQGAAAMAEPAPPAPKWEPREFELEIKGQKQKVRIETEAQLHALLQKATYADQVIKDATQAKRGAADIMATLKAIGQGDTRAFHTLMNDPDIGGDAKKVALAIVQEMMDDEKLTPEQRENRELKKYRDENEAEKKARLDQAEQQKKNEQMQKDATEMRTAIIDSMKKYPDVPQTQATMDACILNMRAAYKRFGKHLTPDQAMSVYSQQYWTAHLRMMESLTPEQVAARYTPKMLDKINQMKLNLLKKKTDPKVLQPNGDSPAKKKKHLTEKEFDQHFKELAGGL